MKYIILSTAISTVLASSAFAGGLGQPVMESTDSVSANPFAGFSLEVGATSALSGGYSYDVEMAERFGGRTKNYAAFDLNGDNGYVAANWRTDVFDSGVLLGFVVRHDFGAIGGSQTDTYSDKFFTSSQTQSFQLEDMTTLGLQVGTNLGQLAIFVEGGVSQATAVNGIASSLEVPTWNLSQESYDESSEIINGTFYGLAAEYLVTENVSVTGGVRWHDFDESEVLSDDYYGDVATLQNTADPVVASIGVAWRF